MVTHSRLFGIAVMFHACAVAKRPRPRLPHAPFPVWRDSCPGGAVHASATTSRPRPTIVRMQRSEATQVRTPDDILALVRLALDRFEDVSLSASVRAAYRIARLRGDADDAWLFDSDLRSVGGSRELRRDQVADLLKEHPTPHEHHNELLERWMEERAMHDVPDFLASRFPEPAIQVGSVAEVETRLESHRRQERSTDHPDGLGRATFYYLAGQLEEILERTRQRAFTYLCRCEAELLFSASIADVFARFRRDVDGFLSEFDPALLDRLHAAYSRAAEETPEARSQALGTCRRLLKATADRVFPPQTHPWLDGSGKPHVVDDMNYRNRLWAFFSDAEQQGARRGVFHVVVDDVGHRVDRVDELTSKGVHGEVSGDEVDVCILQTYFLIGEVFRVHAALRTADTP